MHRGPQLAAQLAQALAMLAHERTVTAHEARSA